MLPDGWQLEKLGVLFDFKNGVNTEAANYGSGLKFVNVMDVFNNHSLTCEKIRERVNVPEKKSDIYLLEHGDILFNRTSETYDEIGLSTVYLDSKPAIFGGFVIRARQTTNKLDPDYCVYSFLSREVRKEIIRRGQGAIRTNIGQGDMRKVPLLLPPLQEQKKIAKILSTWDKAITTTEQLIANCQQQKKALMQQLLTGKKRLEAFSGEWEEVKLGDCFDNVGGTALEKYVKKDSCYHFISIGNYSMDGRYLDKNQRVELNSKTATKLLSKNDLVMVLNDKTKTGDIIGSTILIHENDKYIYNQRSERLILNNKVVPLFFWYLLNSTYIRLEVFKRSQGGTQIYVNFSSVKTIDCFIPELKEQQKIAQVLSSADQEIETLQQKLNLLKEEKKALMQQLLTGKRRVKV